MPSKAICPRNSLLFLLLYLTVAAATLFSAELESKRSDHYLAQDLLQTVIVRTPKWTEIKLEVADGIRKGDIIRIWAGGSIDCGNGDQPGQHICGPAGTFETPPPALEAGKLALSPSSEHAFCLLFKTDAHAAVKCRPPGKPLEIKCAKNGEKLWAGFNDEKDRYQDNHIGKGRRHVLDPLWVRIEVIRIVTD